MTDTLEKTVPHNQRTALEGCLDLFTSSIFFFTPIFMFPRSLSLRERSLFSIYSLSLAYKFRRFKIFPPDELDWMYVKKRQEMVLKSMIIIFRNSKLIQLNRDYSQRTIHHVLWVTVLYLRTDVWLDEERFAWYHRNTITISIFKYKFLTIHSALTVRGKIITVITITIELLKISV